MSRSGETGDTIVTRLEAAAAEAPERTFCVHYSAVGSETISYRRLLDGARAAAVGRVIALPLMAILVVPVHIDMQRGGWITPLPSLGPYPVVAW